MESYNVQWRMRTKRNSSSNLAQMNRSTTVVSSAMRVGAHRSERDRIGVPDEAAPGLLSAALLVVGRVEAENLKQSAKG